MNTLTVCRFETPGAAEAALPRLRDLADQRRIAIDDAALVSWLSSRRKPSIRGLGGLTRPGVLWGGFWGVFLGLVFLVPVAGPTFGAGAGAVAATLGDFGIEDDFLMRVRQLVIPGTSALFVVSDAAAADRLTVELGGPNVGVIRSMLSAEQEQRLRDALGEESDQPIP